MEFHTPGLIILIICIVLLCIGHPTAASSNAPETPDVAKSNNQFALDLYAQLTPQSGNLCLSP
ncbi:hypothetical protein GF339_14185, partial [candidate division KSB3 bacterium]|nr:hypothetical protein [candidate division KSB3 bacterium]